MAKAKKPDSKPATARKSGAKKGTGDADKELATAQAQVEKLRATVEKLEGKLAKSKAKAATWKDEARRERPKVAKLEAKLRRTRRDAPVDHEPPAERGDLPVEDPTVPDESWTVARLRVLAREKQVPGASRLTKAALLAALRG